MADVRELEAALVNADAAGDNEAAATLAAEIMRVRGSTPAPTPAPRDLLKEFAPYYLGPLGLHRAMRDAGEALDSAAYKAGGFVTDKTTEMGASPEVAAGLGYATNVGIQAIPVVAGSMVSIPAGPAIQDKARGIMQSALKPTKADLKSGKAAQAIETMLQKGINVTEGGVAQLRGEIDRLDDMLDIAIRSSNATVDKVQALRPIRDAIAKYRMNANPNADLATIRAAAKEFFNHPALRGSNDIPVDIAQQIKRATYRAVGNKGYGMGLKPASDRDAQKAIAQGLREGIEQAVPEAGPLNAQMAPLINAANIAEERVLMSGNKNHIGLGALIQNPKMFALWLADRSELGKSLLARLLYSGSREIPAAAGGTAGAVPGVVMGRPPREER